MDQESLTLDSLKTLGGLVSAELVKRSVVWTSGGEERKATVYIKPLSFGAAVAGIGSLDRARVISERISECVRDEHGNKVFPRWEYVAGVPFMEKGDEMHPGALCESLTVALLLLIGEVSELSGKQTI